MLRSSSRTVLAVLRDQAAESPPQATNRVSPTTKIESKGVRARLRPMTTAVVVDQSSTTATHPHEVAKYPPWSALTESTRAKTAAAHSHDLHLLVVAGHPVSRGVVNSALLAATGASREGN